MFPNRVRKDGGIGALGTPATAAVLATTTGSGPCAELVLDDAPLDIGEQRFGIGQRQPEVLGPLGRLGQERHLLDRAGRAVVGRDLQRDPCVHSIPLSGSQHPLPLVAMSFPQGPDRKAGAAAGPAVVRRTLPIGGRSGISLHLEPAWANPP